VRGPVRSQPPRPVSSGTRGYGGCSAFRSGTPTKLCCATPASALRTWPRTQAWSTRLTVPERALSCAPWMNTCRPWRASGWSRLSPTERGPPQSRPNWSREFYGPHKRPSRPSTTPSRPSREAYRHVTFSRSSSSPGSAHHRRQQQRRRHRRRVLPHGTKPATTPHISMRDAWAGDTTTEGQEGFTCASCRRLTVTAVQGIFYNPPSDHPAASALQPAEPQPGDDDEQEPQKTPHGNTEEAATAASNLTPRRQKRRSTRPRASP